MQRHVIFPNHLPLDLFAHFVSNWLVQSRQPSFLAFLSRCIYVCGFVRNFLLPDLEAYSKSWVKYIILRRGNGYSLNLAVLGCSITLQFSDF